MERVFNNSIFINCPFDEEYKEMLYAIIFTIYSCGFIPRSALEEDNALNNRLFKIEIIIRECKFGIHDISRIETNINGLPRFNMPFELGLFFGAKIFGDSEHQKKVALVLEREKYAYQQYISDLSGIDTQAHNNNPQTVIKIVNDWLRTSSRRTLIKIDGYINIIAEYNKFRKKILPESAMDMGLDINKLTFSDYCTIVEEALNFNRS